MKIHLNLQEVNNHLSGIGVFEREIAHRIKLGNKQELFGGLFDPKSIFNKGKYQTFHFPVEVSPLRAQWLFNYGSSRKKIPLIRYNSLFKTDCNIYVFFSYRLPRCKINGKIVACIHDLIPLKTEMENKGIVENYINSIKDVADRADIIVTVSENSKSDIVNYLKVSPEKIRVINNGVELELYKNPVNKDEIKLIRNRYNLPEKYILYFGSSRKHKNVESILNAYALLPEHLKKEYKLVITNPNQSIKELALSKNINQNIVFVNAISDEHKVAIYQMASLKLLLSLYEGFGIPVIEAMAAKVPVIASNCSSIPEVAGDAAILVDPLNVEEIVKAIEDVLSDETLRNSLIEKGIINVEKYTWESAAQKFNCIIDELCEVL
ncbi:glycosyltransferase family 4 protein [Paenibacillus glycanilyticus]|uniref:glycosyltransferase family 4 protein n=1 Tax=Paenibacillus glycanilyticus TaxID=126569 RepID=UPI00191095CA|nr:glycosyltransferase family 1 protein [Paenibacillus glycanilyticus]